MHLCILGVLLYNTLQCPYIYIVCVCGTTQWLYYLIFISIIIVISITFINSMNATVISFPLSL